MGVADAALLAAIVGLCAVVALLTLGQTAVGHVTRRRARTLASTGRKGAVALLDLLRRTDDVHTPLALATVLCLLVEATLVGVVANRLLGPVGLVGATVANALVVFVVAIAAPRTWALLDPGRAGALVARPVRALVCHRPVRALVRLVVRVTNVVLPGGGLEVGPYARPDLDAGDEASGSGVMSYDQRQLVESIAELADTVAREVMTPRPDMVMVDASFRVGDVIEVSLLNGFTRLPVCDDDPDRIAGLVYARDLMQAARDGRDREPVTTLVRAAPFVPETKRLPDLLREMQRRQLHMAIVVDEYGGTAGLVTLEDVLEELVGDIVDEFDVESALVEPLPGGDLLVRGRAPLDEVEEQLGTDLPRGDWDTVGGLVTGLLGRLPAAGESATAAGWRLTAERIRGRRIGRVRVARDRPGEAGAGPTRRSSEGDPPEAPSRDGSPDRGDGGFVGGAEALPFGLLVFVLGTLLAVQAWAVVDATYAVDAAAREATRTYVERDVGGRADAASAEAAAVEAGRLALEAHGREPDRAEVELTDLEGPGATSGAFTRCAEVTFTARYDVPALSLPGLDGLGRALEATATHSEVVDPYRDGVPGDVEGC